MVWRSLLCRNVVIKKLHTPISTHSHISKSTSIITLQTLPSFHSSHQNYNFTTFISHNCPNHRNLHSGPLSTPNGSDYAPRFSSKVEGDDADGSTNEFLSRFVWIMRKKLKEVYPSSDKQTIDGMLLIIVGKVVTELEKGGLNAKVAGSDDFSEDLWRTVWDVSDMVLADMNKERKKEKMKGFLQSEEVKEMCRFAGEIGVRGSLLRELRFKWAREKMEEHEFYEGLEKLRKEAQAEERVKIGEVSESNVDDGVEGKSEGVSLPKRRGKINYKIYGLNLSDPKWAEVADRIHKAEEFIWPHEPKLVSGKVKLVTEKILSLNEADDPASMVAEWVDIHQPSRVDWVSLLDKLKEKNMALYLKVSEIALTEKSFQTNIGDYSKLISVYAEESKYDDAERILEKMGENGYIPDPIIASTLIHMYAKAGNFDRAKEAFESLKRQGIQPDTKTYNAMIMSYINAGEPKMGEALLRELETGGMKPTYEMYMALFRSFAHLGDVNGAVRISSSMQFSGFEQTMETCTLLVEVHERAGNPDMARNNFDYMIKLGHKPDDRVTASMISAYEGKNFLDKALNLLMKLEKDGFEPGIATYTVLVDWFAKMQLIDEAEQLLGKIAQQGEAPPLKIQVSLCDMYARAGNEKKALQALGVLEAKKDQLRHDEFERIIRSLLSGGFMQDAQRIRGIMEAQGFTPSQPLLTALSGVDRGRRPGRRF